MKKTVEPNYASGQCIFLCYTLAVKEKLLVSLKYSLDEAVKFIDF